MRERKETKMKKIISGKLYDTDTAKLVGEYQEETDGGSFIFGSLFRKKTGEFFAYTKTTLPGVPDTIAPLDYDGACEWAERHLSADEYVAVFGEPDEGETAVLSVTVPAATRRAIKNAATKRGCSMRDLVVEWAATLDE